MDVFDIERKLRGEPTPEYYEETDDDDDEEDENEGPTDLPTPPGSVKGKPKPKSQKRKRDTGDKDGKQQIKKLRIRLKAPAFEPCILCPNDYKFEEILPTDSGLKAHRSCGLYTPETWISNEHGIDKVCGIHRIDKARLELKCNFCRNKKGAVFQCSQLKCTRAYHATCAIAAAVQIDIGEVPVYDDDGTEYKDTAIDFRCKVHRSKRFKNMDSFALEEDEWIRSRAIKLTAGELVQIQYAQGDIFGGVVIENRKSEQTLLVEVLPKGYVGLSRCLIACTDSSTVTKSKLSTSGYLCSIQSTPICLPHLPTPNRCRNIFWRNPVIAPKMYLARRLRSVRNSLIQWESTCGQNFTLAVRFGIQLRPKLTWPKLNSCGFTWGRHRQKRKLSSLEISPGVRTTPWPISWKASDPLHPPTFRRHLFSGKPFLPATHPESTFMPQMLPAYLGNINSDRHRNQILRSKNVRIMANMRSMIQNPTSINPRR